MLEIKGTYTAIVTPFKKNGEVDFEGLRENIRFQIENNIDGIVPCGTTGESATLSMEEHKKIIDVCVDECNGKIKVIAGTGSNNTKEALELTKHAKDTGADACLLISPYYNKPTQEGIYQHFKKISEIDIPLILYNIQSRTAVNIEPETVKRLMEIDNIIGIKEASSNFDQISKIIYFARDRKNFSVISGNDSQTLPIIALGGKGVISVISNIIPKETKQLVDYCLNGNFEEARKIHYRILNLMNVAFIETNPIPIKYMMNKMKEKGMRGMNAGTLRLPLVELSEKNKIKVDEALKEYGLI
ncbi:MAG: 4-hydroxy-tetrahydrodipicolinate synthase [Candidatus Altarchaeaceae archaeon]